MKKKQDRGKKASFMSEVLEMPKEVATGMPKITIIGFEEILIENYKGILEYEEMYIRINTFIGVINILGTGFNLKQMTEDDISLQGKIEKIEFESDAMGIE